MIQRFGVKEGHRAPCGRKRTPKRELVSAVDKGI
jgi:hypothetical protein